MLLVNGSKGIGTGFSTNIPSYNPVDIITNLKRLMENEESELVPLIPWYKGFKGTIEQKENGNYLTTGLHQVIDTTTIKITELPINTWSQDYKEFLDSSIEKGVIKNFEDKCTETKVSFSVKVSRDTLKTWLENQSIEKELKIN